MAFCSRFGVAASMVDLVGVILFGASSLFAFLTLPVELNASSRAEQLLVNQGTAPQTGLLGLREIASLVADPSPAGFPIPVALQPESTASSS